jgi:EAL domain-containing protein (putative c-di-GMP-specific phosphodiesterase class I)
MRIAGCDLAQGFLLSRPVAKSAALDLLLAGEGTPADAAPAVVD